MTSNNNWEAEVRRIDQRFEDLRAANQVVAQLLENQLAEYKASVNTRLTVMNEVREQIYHERGQYQLREKADAQYAGLFDRLSGVENTVASFTGRLIGMGLALLFFTTVVSIALRFWR